MKEKLTKLLENSCSKYYHYPVAAILECKDGQLFNGVNIETSSPQAGTCAERAALYSAMSNGYKKADFKAIHLMAKSGKKLYPCFICRQALNDICDKKMPIIIYSNEAIETTTVEELCVKAFSDGDLK